MAEKQKQGRKSRKYGRQLRSLAHQLYNSRNQRNKNKIRRAQHVADATGSPVLIKLKYKDDPAMNEIKTIQPKNARAI